VASARPVFSDIGMKSPSFRAIFVIIRPYYTE